MMVRPSGVSVCKRGGFVCDVRYLNGKMHTKRIKSWEEGALYYDITKIYESKVRGGGQNLNLNYPEFSASLHLEELPDGFQIQPPVKKGEASKLILKQAQAAAKNLDCYQRNLPKVVGTQRSSIQGDSSISLPSANEFATPDHVDDDSTLHAARDQQHSLGACPFGGPDESRSKFEQNIDKVKDIMVRDVLTKKSKYIQMIAVRKDLERKLAAFHTDPQLFCASDLRSKIFQHMARLEQTIIMLEDLPRIFLEFDSAYNSEQANIRNLQSTLEGYQRDFVSECLERTSSRNGRERPTESEIWPELEDIIIEPPDSPDPSMVEAESREGQFAVTLTFEQQESILHDSPSGA